jgi:hypothetical protein
MIQMIQMSLRYPMSQMIQLSLRYQMSQLSLKYRSFRKYRLILIQLDPLRLFHLAFLLHLVVLLYQHNKEVLSRGFARRLFSFSQYRSHTLALHSLKLDRC